MLLVIQFLLLFVPQTLQDRLNDKVGRNRYPSNVFIDRSQPYNILSSHQSQVHGFRELTSQDQQRHSPERGIVLVFHKDDTDKFFIRKVYSIGLQDVYCDNRVYNAAHFYTLDQQQRAQEIHTL